MYMYTTFISFLHINTCTYIPYIYHMHVQMCIYIYATIPYLYIRA